MLEIWVVYHRPRDLPEFEYVARPQVALRNGTVVGKPEFVTGDTLDEVRWKLPPGLACLARHPDDDPVIVETWI